MATPPFRVKAVYDYSSPHDDDLSFPNGQFITVTDEEDEDWYYGEYTDTNGTKQEGLFPRNFVERYEPETPPRPSRSTRVRKEPEPPQPPLEPVELEAPEHDEPERELEAEPITQTVKAPQSEPPLPEPSARQIEVTTPQTSSTNADPLPPQNLPVRQPSQSSSSKAPPSASNNIPSRSTGGATASGATKPVPPSVVEKPIGGSFKDRIAAFNKPAGPVAPAKPAGLGQPGGSGFVKKPFVAPPPSKNAYVPPPREPLPQTVYRREEDSKVPSASANRPANEPDPAPSAEHRDAVDEDQPKPTSLKERIALLQKQQMEQAARQASGGQKKEKPKKPPKKRRESDHAMEGMVAGAEQSQPMRESLDTSRNIADTSEEAPVARSKGKESVKTSTRPIQTESDGNEADQSGAGNIEEGDGSTKNDVPGERAVRRAPTMDQGTRLFGAPPPSMPVRQDSHELNIQGGQAHKNDDNNDNDQAEDEEADEEDEEEEEEVDPEVRRRQEIRERMAKMSGGMGMAGMFGPPMGFSPVTSKGGKTASRPKNSTEPDASHGDVPAPRMLPIPGMALPGMQRPKEPKDEGAEVSKENEEPAISISEQHEPDLVADVEDIGPQRAPKPQVTADDANETSPSQSMLLNTLS